MIISPVFQEIFNETLFPRVPLSVEEDGILYHRGTKPYIGHLRILPREIKSHIVPIITMVMSLLIYD